MTAPRSALRWLDALRDRWLCVLLLCGLAIRVALALALDAGLEPLADERTYLRFAAEFRQTGRLETGVFVRPPLYFLFVSVGQWLLPGWGSPALGVRLLQALLGAWTALPIFCITQRVGGRRAARVAAAVVLLDPTLVAYTHLLWPETVFTFVVATVVERLPFVRSAGPVGAIGVGVWIGLALLLKPVFGLFCLILAASWLVDLGPASAARLVLWVGGTAVLVISPWLVRNQLRYGPSILLENQGAYNLWVGNAPETAREVRDQWHALPDPVTRARVARDRGIAAVRDDPERFAASVPRRMLNLWGLEFFVVMHAVLGGYGPLGKGTLVAGFWVIQAAWAGLLVLAALGVGRVARDPTLRVLLVYAGVVTLLVSAMVSTTRFRVPLAPLLAAAAGLGLEELRVRGLRRRTLLPALAAGAVLLVSAARPPFSVIGSGDFERVEDLRRGEWRSFRY